MAQEGHAKVAAAGSIAATIAAVAAWLASRKVVAGEIPDEVIQLLIAIAASSDTISVDIKEVISLLSELGISVQGWPANTDSITCPRVTVNPITGMQLPYIVVPSGMQLVIKAHALNPGWIQVGPTAAEAGQLNSSFPLLPSETAAYQVENADQIFLGATAAGCVACLTVEQRRRGGG